jgi:hypothetical protein
MAFDDVVPKGRTPTVGRARCTARIRPPEECPAPQPITQVLAAHDRPNPRIVMPIASPAAGVPSKPVG